MPRLEPVVVRLFTAFYVLIVENQYRIEMGIVLNYY